MSVAWFFENRPNKVDIEKDVDFVVTPVNIRHTSRHDELVSNNVEILDIEDEDHSFTSFFVGINDSQTDFKRQKLVKRV